MENELKKQIYDLLMKYYHIYKSNPSNEIKNKYDQILKIYRTINDKDINFIKKYFQENSIPKEVNDIYLKVTGIKKSNKEENEKIFISTIKKELYNSLLEEYNKIKSNKSSKDKYIYMKKIYEEINNKERAIEVISVFRKIKKELEFKNEGEQRAILSSLAVFINVSKELGFIEQDKKETANETKNLPKKTTKYNYTSKDPDINNFINISNEILKLQEKVNSIDNTTEEAIIIRKEINKLCDRRESILMKYMDIEGMILSKELESLETSYVKEDNKGKIKPYKLTKEEYKKELKDTINKLNDLKFYKNNSKYSNNNYEEKLKETLSKYNNLVYSLYKENNPIIYSDNMTGLDIRSENLLSYLELYNLNGGYSEFKRTKDTLRIGNQIVTSSVYEKNTKEIINMIDTFINNSYSMIKDNILITDNSRNKDSIMDEMNNKIKDAITKIQMCKNNKNYYNRG